MTRPSEVRAALSRLGLQPNRTLGQNFLIDGNILGILLEAGAIGPDDRVLEIGPGLGAVTEALCERAAHVVAIEKDAGLAAFLKDRFAGTETLEVVHADALDCDLAVLLRERKITKMISNLPYSAGSRILVECARAASRPHRMAVTVQKEVADRMIASSNTRDYGLLSVVLQLHYIVRKVKVVAPGCFYPPPQIKSAIVALEHKEAVSREEDDRVFRLAKFAFEQRRKQLGTILARLPEADTGSWPSALDTCGLTPSLRPENLAVDQWRRLANALYPD